MSSNAWHALADGAWLFEGKTFSDERGDSWEALDLSACDAPVSFAALQENVVRTARGGCARGLHYQLGASAQAKFVSVVKGSAQFFWISLSCSAERPIIHSSILSGPGRSLYTPSNCAHGFLALEDDTVFILRMSRPVDPSLRGEVNFLSPQLALSPARPIRSDQLSERDRNAPDWSARRL